MFVGKIIAITGGASGIGLSMVDQFLELGATVWVFDINQDNLTNMVHLCEQNGEPPRTFCGDVSKKSDLKRFRDTILKEEDAIDYWINNAGISGIASLTSTDFDKVIDINLKAVINGSKLAFEVMKDRGFGHIVNVASVAGYVPAPYMTGYNATKFGVIGFTRALQAELEVSASAVQAHILSPGFVKTPMTRNGTDASFPDWLEFGLAKPEKVASDLILMLKKNEKERISTWNGKLMNFMYRIIPNRTVRSSKALLSKSPKDFLTGNIDIPD